MQYDQLVAEAFLALLKERTEANLNDYVKLLNHRETNSEATALLGYFGDILYHCGWRGS